MYRKNTASQYLGFVAVKAADGTAMTGLTIGSFGKYRSIDGGAQASCTGTISETANGQYVIALSQADTNGNDISFLFTYSGMIPVEKTIVTTTADPTDTVRFGLTSLPNAAAGASTGLPLSVDSSGRVDVLKVNGTSQTARDLGASVLLSAGTGAGQLDFTSGVVKSSLVQILGTALTETAGQLAAAFKQFFNIGSPTSTMNLITGVTTVTNLTNAPTAGDFNATQKTSLNAATPASVQNISAQTGDSYARIGAAGSGLTGLGDVRIANLDAAISSRTKPADTQAAVTTVTNLTNAPTAGDFTATMKTSLNSSTPTVPVSVKKNTALAKFAFVMTDSTNHAPATGKTVVCTRSIDGGAFGAGTLANVAELSNGVYLVDFLAADLNGNVVVLRATSAGCDDALVTLVTAQ